ncbi:MAG: SDR family oxidoreductase [Acidobacteria bacterium]|nr:SDR family oxidoreductase [Acidobacteriota bacterium]
MAVEIDLTGRTVLVTGGTKGVGRGIAQRFAEAGATVVVCARRQAEDPLPSDWHFIAADLRDGDAAWAAVDAAAAIGGRLDIVVNNAGGSPPADSAEAPTRFTQRIVELNLLAPYYVAQRAHHHMHRQPGGGSIINIGSVVANRPSPTTAAYGAAKAGLKQLTTTLAMEWAPRVRVNTITVGLILTEQAELFYGEGETRQRIEAGIPMGRFALPTDVGDIAVWLASDLAGYVTGAEIAAHGGGERPPFLGAE